MNLRQIYNKHMDESCEVVDRLGLSNVEEVFSHLFRGDLLEVGCGNGKLGLTLLSDKSVDSVAFLDVSDVCIEYVCQGIRKFAIMDRDLWALYRDTLEECEFTKRGNFNTITFFEGLEHVIDVKVAVDRIHSLLRDGGIFIGSVPVGTVCDHPTHLHHFHEGDIQEVLSDKFSSIEVKSILVRQETDERHYVFKAMK